MKYLIINADDFGASEGINRGIIEAHRYGIVTSASLLVNSPASVDAATLTLGAQRLSVGLHVDFGGDLEAIASSPERARDELWQQFERFKTLTGCHPTHLDSCHDIHRQPQLQPHFASLASQYGLPLRNHSAVRYYPAFSGPRNGETQPEQISMENFMHIVQTEVRDGVTELTCHPGFADASFSSAYSIEREMELHTLCNPSLRRRLVECAIYLMSYHDLSQVVTHVAA